MKALIRDEMKAKRRNMNKNEVAEKSRKAAQLFLNSGIYKSAKIIMLYMPLGNETDTGEIIRRAFADGKTLVLPVTDEQSGRITPYVLEQDTLLEKGGFSVVEPRNSEPIEKSEIDAVLVPGIAFDKKGARLGFGRGCYDMFLEKMKAVKLGYCYSFQLLDEIPSDSHDIRMDYIITEKEINGMPLF